LLGHGVLASATLKLQCFIFSGNIASIPYINRNDVKFIALQTVVLWLHTAVGMAFSHFPFFSPSKIFFIAFLIAPFDCGWYTNAKVTFVPIY
jgi:hypothetical protein